jgi:hypothetical protein
VRQKSPTPTPDGTNGGLSRLAVSLSGRNPGQYGVSSSAKSAFFGLTRPATGVFAAKRCTSTQETKLSAVIPTKIATTGSRPIFTPTSVKHLNGIKRVSVVLWKT